MNPDVIKVFYNFNEFMELIMNDSEIETTEITKTAMNVYKLDEKYAYSLYDLIFAKFPDIVSNENLIKDERNAIFDHISKNLKITPNIVVGVVALITKRNQMSEVLELAYNILKLNKMNPDKYIQFWALYLLYTSS